MGGLGDTPWDEEFAVVLLGKHHYGFTPAKERSFRLVISPRKRNSNKGNKCKGNKEK